VSHSFQTILQPEIEYLQTHNNHICLAPLTKSIQLLKLVLC
jgi:hypothetical protein